MSGSSKRARGSPEANMVSERGFTRYSHYTAAIHAWLPDEVECGTTAGPERHRTLLTYFERESVASRRVREIVKEAARMNGEACQAAVGNAALAKSIFDSDDQTMAQSLRGLGLRTKSDEHDGYVALGNAYGGDLIRGAAGTGYIDMEMLEGSYQDAVRLIRENPVVAFPPEMLMIGRVFGLLSGLSKQLDARTDLREVFRPFFEDEPEVDEASTVV